MRVLGVDDDSVSRLVLRATVGSLGHECLLAADGRQAWDIVQRGGVDVVITDRMMPDMDGLELCRRIREQPNTGYVYVVLASVLDAHDQVREGMLAGADDYLLKPLRRHDVELRLIAAERVSAGHRQLEQATSELRMIARRDPLTGLGNRLALQEELATLAHRADRYGHRYSIALLDLDHFKAVNDDLGHQAGDDALHAVGQLLAASCRGGDTCYRYGGEEFLCIFPEQSAETAGIAVRRLQQDLIALAIPNAASSYGGQLTFSAGIAELNTHTADVDGLLRQTDLALYRAKANGRNRVEVVLPSDGVSAA